MVPADKRFEIDRPAANVNPPSRTGRPNAESMQLTFVFPCLNEEATLEDCIRAVRRSLDSGAPIEYEIVVADNGSTDRSAEIAESLGARVVPVCQRGYGAASGKPPTRPGASAPTAWSSPPNC